MKRPSSARPKWRPLAAAAVALVASTLTSCEGPTSCEGAIGLRWLDHPPEVRARMQRIAWRESRHVPTARNGQHLGCLQIATTVHAARIARMGYTRADMLRAWPNIQVGYALWRESGWRPWAT